MNIDIAFLGTSFTFKAWHILIINFVSLTIVAFGSFLVIRSLYQLYYTLIINPSATKARTSSTLSNARILVIIGLVAGLTLSFLIGFFVDMILGVAVLLLFLYLPQILAKRHVKNRLDKFNDQFPDAMMSLASSLKAGTSLIKGLEYLAQTQPSPFSEEMRIVVSEYNLGASIEEAMKTLHTRNPSQEAELFATTISIAQTVGGELSETIEVLAETLKEKSAIEGKIRALTAQGKAQSLVMVALPFLLVGALLFIMPEETNAMFTRWYGKVFIACNLFLIFLAYKWIQKIVTIDI